MKVIILAAGEGTRLKKYTKDLPKGMLQLKGKTIIERQLNIFRNLGLNDISIVKGFQPNTINYPGVKYYLNKDYSTTNMVASLMIARKEFNDDVIVSYSDIIFNEKLLKNLILSKDNISVSVDTEWKRYWELRYGQVDFDIETLKLNKQGFITSLGKETNSLKDIDARIIGLFKFSKSGIQKISSIWDKEQNEFWNKPWKTSGKTLRNSYMTDMVQAALDEGEPVKAVKENNGWLELDTNKDFERAIEWDRLGELEKLLGQSI